MASRSAFPYQGLSQATIAALDAANAPTGGNPFVTESDLPVTHVGAKVRRTADQALNNGDNTITWQTDTGSGCWDDAAFWENGDPTKLVAPTTGDYLVGYTVVFDTLTANDARVTIRKNGSDEVYESGSTLKAAVGAVLVEATAADYFDLVVSGAALSGQSLDTASRFWIVRMKGA